MRGSVFILVEEVVRWFAVDGGLRWAERDGLYVVCCIGGACGEVRAQIEVPLNAALEAMLVTSGVQVSELGASAAVAVSAAEAIYVCVNVAVRNRERGTRNH